MKNQKAFWTMFLFLLLFCVPTFAQGQTQQERVQRQRDEEAVRNMRDPGFDLAFVVAQKANIREDADRASKVLRQVERGEALALIEREPVGTWYKVIHVGSGVEGWIDGSVVVIKLTANRYNAPRFQEERTDAEQNPEVSITNLEKSTDLNLRINGRLYIIPSNSTKRITFEPGRYEYYGWSPGIRPAIGRHDLIKGIRYSWTFRIERR